MAVELLTTNWERRCCVKGVAIGLSIGAILAIILYVLIHGANLP